MPSRITKLEMNGIEIAPAVLIGQISYIKTTKVINKPLLSALI